MGKNQPTWIVLHRNVSGSIPIQGQRRTDVAIVLDQATGLVVKINIGTSQASAIDRALKDAVIRPAEPLPKVIPRQIVCPPELIDAVEAAGAKLSKLADTSIIEGVEMWDAEEILDGFIGHMEGRVQPGDPPSVGDWRTLYEALDEYFRSAPWQRRCDEDYFDLRLDLDGRSVARIAIVLGNAGIQQGFNVMADRDALHRASVETDAPLRHLEEALIVHLNPRREASDLFAAKARRYGWPQDAARVPHVLTVSEGQPADLSRDDARLLALALRAVVAQDARRLVAVGAHPTTGELRFEDDITGRFVVTRPGPPHQH